MKHIVQSFYDRARKLPPFATLVNFFMARERAYRRAFDESKTKALGALATAGGSGIVTAAGILQGMKWPRAVIVGSEFTPKVLGTYELEIQDDFRRIIAEKGATSFIDIGAAEGYYAVGAALLRPSLKVLAYELKAEAHDGIRELAALNGVAPQVEVFGLFVPALLDRRFLGARPCVLVDIDGAEAQLVNDEFMACFRDGTIILEIHDFAVPGIGRRLHSLLERSHNVRRISYQQRLRGKVGHALGLSALEWQMATDELRPHGNYWLIAEPRESSAR